MKPVVSENKWKMGYTPKWNSQGKLIGETEYQYRKRGLDWAKSQCEQFEKEMYSGMGYGRKGMAQAPTHNPKANVSKSRGHGDKRWG